VEDANEERVLPPLAALPHLPEREVSGEEARLLRNGRSLPGGGEGPVALWLDGGELVAVGRAEGGAIRPETVFL
jgi:hypothetical protein